MTAPTKELPAVRKIAKLSKKAQIAYGIRCAQRAEPLYADKKKDVVRARYLRNCIDAAVYYFETGELLETTVSLVNEPPKGSDYAQAAGRSLSNAALTAYAADHDPEYDAKEAKQEEATPAHRISNVGTYALFATYDAIDPMEEARRCERIALAAALEDFAWLTENPAIADLAEMGPLWKSVTLEVFAERLALHEATLRQ